MSNKLNYLLIPAIILLMIGNGVLYQKTSSLKEQNLNIEKENLELKNKLAKDRGTTISLSDFNWKTYKNEKYGFEMNYPDKSMGFENKIEEDKTGQSNFEISLYHELPSNIIIEPNKDIMKKEVILGIVGVNKFSDKNEMEKIIQSAKLSEQDRTNAYLQNDEQIVISPEIIAYKMSFVFKKSCQTPNEKINDEDIHAFYYIVNYEKKLYILASANYNIAFNKCSHPDFWVPSYTQTKEYYKNQLRQYILNDQIISSIKFVK